MKKILKLAAAFILIFVCTAAAFTVSASNFEDRAASLKELGLFYGASNGDFELDRAATRAEAATMLVRLMGKEKQALSGTYSYPFTDVPQWAEKYIGFLYQNKLAYGISESEFGCADECSGQMYLTFLMRVLGYSDASGDFSYEKVQEFAASKGLFTSSTLASGDFLRDDIAALSYSVLFTETKDSEDILLKKMDSDGALDKQEYEKYAAIYDAFNEYSKKSAANSKMTSMQLSAKADMKITSKIDMGGMKSEETAQMIADYDIKLVGADDPKNMKLQASITADTDGQTSNASYYLADGWCYVEADGIKQKFQMDLSDSGVMMFTGETALPFYLFESIEKTESAEGCTYNIKLSSKAVYSLIETFMSALTSSEEGSMSCSFSDVSLSINLDKDGRLISEDIKMVMTLSMQDEFGTAAIEYDIAENIVLVSEGEAVKVVPPSDLDSYQDADSFVDSGSDNDASFNNAR